MPTSDLLDGSPGTSAVYTKEIQGMMYGFGDSREPSRETAELVEKILKNQLTQLVVLLTETSVKIGSKKIGVKEFLILLRHNPVKLRRFCKYLQVTNFKKLVESSDHDKQVDDIELSQIHTDSKELQDALSFLQHLDPSGYLLSVADPTRPSPLLDESLLERNTRIESMTSVMNVQQYLEYAKLKACSFKRNQPLNKFQDWLLQGSSAPHVAISPKAWDILSYFAYETVAQIVDLSFIVRRDNDAAWVPDAVERNAIPRVTVWNAELNKPTWSHSMVPLQVAEVTEAMRRYSDQQFCCSPFTRNIHQRPSHRLLAL